MTSGITTTWRRKKYIYIPVCDIIIKDLIMSWLIKIPCVDLKGRGRGIRCASPPPPCKVQFLKFYIIGLPKICIRPPPHPPLQTQITVSTAFSNDRTQDTETDVSSSDDTFIWYKCLTCLVFKQRTLFNLTANL